MHVLSNERGETLLSWLAMARFQQSLLAIIELTQIQIIMLDVISHIDGIKLAREEQITKSHPLLLAT